MIIRDRASITYIRSFNHTLIRATVNACTHTHSSLLPAPPPSRTTKSHEKKEASAPPWPVPGLASATQPDRHPEEWVDLMSNKLALAPAWRRQHDAPPRTFDSWLQRLGQLRMRPAEKTHHQQNKTKMTDEDLSSSRNKIATHTNNSTKVHAQHRFQADTLAVFELIPRAIQSSSHPSQFRRISHLRG